MSIDDADDIQIERASAGDRDALELLLLRHFDRIAAHASARLPDDVRNVLSGEDVAQDACVVAFQRIASFESREVGNFFGWLARIAENCLMDAVKSLRAAKRGGGHAPLANASANDESDAVSLLDLLSADSWTASRSTVRREDLSAMEAAMQRLEPDYREVLRLRFVESQPFAQIAERMRRSEGAVHMLLSRALAALRARVSDVV